MTIFYAKTDLSTQKTPSCPRSRLPKSPIDPKWSSRPQKPTQQRTKTADLAAMLPRGRRIRSQRDHQTLMRRARWLRGKLLTVRAMPGAVTTTRIGFVISTAVSKSAVKRNTIRRRLQAIAATIPPTPPADIVVIAHRSAVGQPSAALAKEFLSLLDSIRHAPRR